MSQMSLPPSVEADIEAFLTSVRAKQGDYRGKEETSTAASQLDIAKETITILRKLVECLDGEQLQLQSLIQYVRLACKKLKTAYPYGTLVANVARRILYVIRDECSMELKTSQKESNLLTSEFSFNPALDSQLTSVPSMLDACEDSFNYKRLQENILEHLSSVDFQQEFDSTYKNISRQAVDHIAEGESILTYGYSKTVEKFLIAAKKTNFNVIVCEAAPQCGGHRLAAKLVEQEIKVTVIPDALAFAYMSRVSKVIVGSYLVVANGGMIGPSGYHGIAVAAQHHRVPVIVCAATMKLTPTYPSTTDLSEFGRYGNPEEIMPLSEVSASTDPEGTNWVQVVNPTVDYVAPELIALFITSDDCGRAYAPSYIYRLLLQFYNPDDNDI